MRSIFLPTLTALLLLPAMPAHAVQSLKDVADAIEQVERGANQHFLVSGRPGGIRTVNRRGNAYSDLSPSGDERVFSAIIDKTHPMSVHDYDRNDQVETTDIKTQPVEQGSAR